MLFLEGEDVFGLEQEIVVLGGRGGAVDDDGGADEALGVDRVDGVVGHVLAADPVRRRVEMCAGVLAHRDVAPVPGGAFLVVAADHLAAERRRGAELGRQLDDGEVLVERVGEIDDA